ncbi:MAG: 4Fe-4S binding protein [Thermodesulfobacteriaceae bacterium]|nr:4Fe-4S binding protein [Thermodesulfobacteriaceae bacterium]
MRLEVLQEKIFRDFVGERVETFDQCFRCGACSGICPVKKTTHIFDPRKIIHIFLLGYYDKLNEVLWYCSQCGSCISVCPMVVKPKDVIKAIRDFLLERGIISLEKLFEIGAFARVNPDKCIVCLTCVRTCPWQAASIKEKGVAYIDPNKCRACGLCVMECPARAIELKSKGEGEEVKV